MKYISSLMVVLSLASAIAQVPDQKPDEKFASEVLFFANDNKTHRFAGPVSFSFIGDPGEFREPFLAGINEFNSATSGLPVQINVAADNTEAAQIVVRFKQEKVMNSLFKRTFDGKGNLTRVEITVVVSPDMPSPKSFSRLYIHNVWHSMGFGPCGKDVRSDSFWSIWSPNNQNPPMSPTSIDKQIARFFYEKVPSGSTKLDVKKLVKKEFE